MKKIILMLLSGIIALSFSTIVFAANHAKPCTVKTVKQLIQMEDDDPVPAPDPVPEPAPAPEPTPEPEP